MSLYFSVRAHALNLRSTPKRDERNRIALLPQGLRIEKLEESASALGWWRVRAWLEGQQVEGWTAAEYLDPVADAPEAHALEIAAPAITLPAARFENHALARLNSKDARHAHISEPNQPRRAEGGAPQPRVDQLNGILDFLNVEHAARYAPDHHTYCNIYATDYCYLAGCYVPRVWWKQKVVADILAGQPAPPPRYDQTVEELNANSLYNWMNDFSASFGWTRVFSLDELQTSANAGGVGVIVARRINLNRSGHITVVVPETDANKAARSNGAVAKPLQSQAGARNFKRKAMDFWLQPNQFSAFGFWTHL